MLKPNAHIAVVAPSGIPTAQGLDEGIALVRSWGYRVSESPHLRERHLFTAGTPQARIDDLRWALTTPGIDAVWLARGGYGCVHTLAALSELELDDRWLIGYSDATALFCALAPRRRPRLMHGQTIDRLPALIDAESLARLRAMLAGEPVAALAAQQIAGPATEVAGPLVGGNLCVLASLAGTPWALQARDAIVVLEDVGEAPYRLHRFIQQLRWSGAFDGVRAVALGEFVSCKLPPGVGYTLQDVLLDALSFLQVPLYSGLPVGHGERNLAWVHGEALRYRQGCFEREARTG